MNLEPAVTFALVLAALVVGGFLVAILAGRATGLSRYRKTLVSAAGTTITYLLATYPAEAWVQKYLAPLSGLLTVLGVFQIANEPPKGEPADPAVSEKEPGA